MGSAEVQGELWGRDPQAWAGFQEPQMRPIYDATLDALEPLADAALLDAGCGSGLVVALAAGRGAAASGLDASAPLLQVARARTTCADLCTGDIEALPYRGLWLARRVLQQVIDANPKHATDASASRNTSREKGTK